MKDRIEHTEHKRRDPGTPNMSFAERRYGATTPEDVDREAGDRPDVQP